MESPRRARESSYFYPSAPRLLLFFSSLLSSPTHPLFHLLLSIQLPFLPIRYGSHGAALSEPRNGFVRYGFTRVKVAYQYNNSQCTCMTGVRLGSSVSRIYPLAVHGHVHFSLLVTGMGDHRMEVRFESRAGDRSF